MFYTKLLFPKTDNLPKESILFTHEQEIESSVFIDNFQKWKDDAETKLNFDEWFSEKTGIVLIRPKIDCILMSKT